MTSCLKDGGCIFLRAFTSDDGRGKEEEEEGEAGGEGVVCLKLEDQLSQLDDFLLERGVVAWGGWAMMGDGVDGTGGRGRVFVVVVVVVVVLVVVVIRKCVAISASESGLINAEYSPKVHKITGLLASVVVPWNRP